MKCAFCGQEFNKTSKMSRAKYCSVECRGKAVRFRWFRVAVEEKDYNLAESIMGLSGVSSITAAVRLAIRRTHMQLEIASRKERMG
jgi:hypothetical protein